MSDEIWVVRAGEKARFADDFLRNGLIAVGFRDIAADDLTTVSLEALKSRAIDAVGKNFAGQLATFRFRIDVGDTVIVPRLPKHRDYLWGSGTVRYLAG